MAKLVYFLVTFLESGLSVFGIRAPFEERPYRVIARVSQDVEIRAYGPSVAVETRMRGNDGDAFSRLFRYITGANAPQTTIAMTTPVEMRGMTKGDRGVAGEPAVMRFFLPEERAADPPAPADPRVAIVRLPARTVAVLRFSGAARPRERFAAGGRSDGCRRQKRGRTTESAPYVMGYDPPFTIPFLRRNEVAIDLRG